MSSGTRKSVVPPGESRRAACSVSTNGPRENAAEPAVRRLRARSTPTSVSSAPVPPQHAIVEIDDDQPVGQRLDDAVAELAEPLDLVRLVAELAVQPRVLDRRRRLAGHRAEQAHVLAAERLAVRRGGPRPISRNRQLVRHARHEAERARRRATRAASSPAAGAIGSGSSTTTV